MELTFEVELDYGDDGPDEGEATPEASDIEAAVNAGLAQSGFASVDVRATKL